MNNRRIKGVETRNIIIAKIQEQEKIAKCDLTLVYKSGVVDDFRPFYKSVDRVRSAGKGSLWQGFQSLRKKLQRKHDL